MDESRSSYRAVPALLALLVGGVFVVTLGPPGSISGCEQDGPGRVEASAGGANTLETRRLSTASKNERSPGRLSAYSAPAESRSECRPDRPAQKFSASATRPVRLADRGDAGPDVRGSSDVDRSPPLGFVVASVEDDDQSHLSSSVSYPQETRRTVRSVVLRL